MVENGGKAADDGKLLRTSNVVEFCYNMEKLITGAKNEIQTHSRGAQNA